MTALGPEFRDRLEDLDHEAYVALAAAVYDARGWTVERVDDGVVATPPRGDHSRRLDVGRTDADVDAATLHEMVAYALDPADRERICRRFFDCDPEAFADETEWKPEGESGGTASGESRERERGTAADAPGAALSDRGSAADGTTTAGPDDGRDTSGAHDGGRGPAATDERVGGERTDGSAWNSKRAAVVGLAVAVALAGIVSAAGPALTSSEEASPEVSYPRGVEASGITDASALADAHEVALSGRSFELTVVHREYVDGELRGIAQERAVVASRNHYRSHVEKLGTVEHERMVVADGSAYANGTTRYVQPIDGRNASESAEIRRTVPSAIDSDRFVDRTEQYVQWYLSVDDSRVVETADRNGTAYYRIAFEGDPWPGVTETTGYARVDEDGLVRVIHREYVPEGESGVYVETTVRITPRSVTVTRPSWAGEAPKTPTPRPRNGSGSGSYDRRPPVYASQEAARDGVTP